MSLPKEKQREGYSKMVLYLKNIELKSKGFILKDSRDPIPISYTPFREIRLVDLYLRRYERIFEVRIHLYKGGTLPILCASEDETHGFFNQLVSLMES